VQQRKILAKSFWFLPQKITEKKKGSFFLASWGKEKADKTFQLNANL
jgi:hypothetical protein